MTYTRQRDLLRLAIQVQSEQGAGCRANVERGLYLTRELDGAHGDGRDWSATVQGPPEASSWTASPHPGAGGGPGRGPSASPGSAIRRVLFLYVPQDVLVSRLASRYTCATAGPPTTCSPSPLPAAGSATSAGTTPLYQRVDDQLDKVERGSSVDLGGAPWPPTTTPSRGILCEVDSNRPAPEVAAALIAAVEGCRHGPPK